MSESIDHTNIEQLAFDISTLREAGHFKEAFELSRRLIAHDPYRLDFRFLEFDILNKARERSLLESRILDAMTYVPSSIELNVYYAAVAMWYFDWPVAIERLSKIRALFSTDDSVDVAATVLDEFLCYFEMTNLDLARDLIDRNWSALKKWPASSYKGRNEVFEILSVIDDDNRDAYISWSAEALGPIDRKNYLARMGAAAQIHGWAAKNVGDISIVSLGQNCLPWLVPNRWGLRPSQHTAKPMSVFDYLGTPNQGAAELIDNNFSDLLSTELLINKPFPNGAPMLMNKKYRILFFHEKGTWWASDDWRRLRDIYDERIRYFLNGAKIEQRLYLFCVGGPCDIDIVVRCFIERLSGRKSRLLIINAQDAPLETVTDNEYVTLKNIPYPKNYSFVDRDSFESDRGHVFESSIANSIVAELKLMQASHSRLNNIWDRVRSISKRTRNKTANAH